ncbi:MAG: outer membrane protein transport protein [Pseudomonadota bacterium]
MQGPLFARVGLSAIAIAIGTTAATTTSHAGGFAIREQSASSQGASFAGSAAGFDLSSMYWNPAAVTTKNGMNSESHVSVILGSLKLTSEGGAIDGLGIGDDSGQLADPALVSTSYLNYQMGDVYFGISLNAPFGLTTKPENNWDGQVLGYTSKLLTINAAPTVGYKIMPGVAVAVGVQVQYIDTRLTTLTGTALDAVNVEGDDIGFGFTAGVLLEPTKSTKIGLGFRSSVSHTLEGEQDNALGSSDIEADVDLPELVTLSLRQDLTNKLTFLGTVEWTNWSRVQTIDIVCTGVDGAACQNEGDTLNTLSLNYDDGWFFAAGLEYAYSSTLLLRTGIAYEISPAREDTSRTVRLADNDRLWVSVGATYNWSANTAIDFSYTHIFVEDGKINQTDENSGADLIADADAHVDIISASVKMKW